jgi:hypothetical protein
MDNLRIMYSSPAKHEQIIALILIIAAIAILGIAVSIISTFNLISLILTGAACIATYAIIKKRISENSIPDLHLIAMLSIAAIAISIIVVIV